MKEIKFKYLFSNNKGGIHLSNAYTLPEIEAMCDPYEDILIKEVKCNCQPIGETNVVECNCDTFYDDFELKERLLWSGLRDKNGTEIYRGDTIKFLRAEQGDEANAYPVEEAVSLYCGSFMYASVPLSSWAHKNGLVDKELTNRHWLSHGASRDIYMIDFDIEVTGNMYVNREHKS